MVLSKCASAFDTLDFSFVSIMFRNAPTSIAFSRFIVHVTESITKRGELLYKHTIFFHVLFHFDVWLLVGFVVGIIGSNSL